MAANTVDQRKGNISFPFRASEKNRERSRLAWMAGSPFPQYLQRDRKRRRLIKLFGSFLSCSKKRVLLFPTLQCPIVLTRSPVHFFFFFHPLIRLVSLIVIFSSVTLEPRNVFKIIDIGRHRLFHARRNRATLTATSSPRPGSFLLRDTVMYTSGIKSFALDIEVRKELRVSPDPLARFPTLVVIIYEGSFWRR